ncbi:MinD-like ATPase involved in chromosome partitioning or flagellar assembly [Saccharopolyspora kobensis]|uniref:MinD-like ATPase involved in chromosome partitioning or flagellar assembly n=1 Tax=Saccharopolyspora kobensis TaxID=146035 RepID=A0A1H6DXE5_9PSEU|nr:MinD/ParA family protein [Saccharopolyspora kobensis]SEG89948.1 MinD-like ATPase involved in chromosome partitioning or flagellar assembly [Saccharopolyspora kobensis]SFD88239.1 MinD-like ATPase involved in chromosome partitioning or flagellar assembly [Saccharopolyspora kobensis]
MTGQYEEPEARRDAGTTAAQPDAESGSTQYIEPETRPAHPTPSYVDPSQVDQAGDAPQPYYPGGAPAGGATPGNGDPTQSGPQPQFPDPSASGPHPQASGPHQVPGAQSGPYSVSGGPSGPYPPVSGGPSGPYSPVSGGPSGPYAPVSGGPSGPYAPVSGGQSGPYPTGAQQFPQGGPQPGPQQSFSSYPQAAPNGGPGDQPFGQDLSSAQLLRQTKRSPQSGWRKAVYLASGKTVNFGEGPADRRRRELIGRINQPLQGCYKIAMLSLKGGVGKTTTTATLGSTFSSLRGDRVIAVDANPDRGTLAQKIPLETTATVRHLLRDAHRIRKYSDVRAYTSQGPSRLEVLASEQDPAVSEAFSEDDYRRTVTLLEHFYNVVLTDCGTGLMHSAMKGVLDLADSLVIVSSGSIDGARSASATLDWLDAHGYGDLVARSVAVINSVRPGSGKVDVDKLTAHFSSRCRAVSKIPFDPHLEEGAEVELDQLAAPTRMALLELAATVADDFPHAPGRNRQA